LSASQPPDQLAASSANALGHAANALVSARSTPLARAVARDAIARQTRAWSASEPDSEELALAALLAGWAVDRSGLGPHHALSQTAVRIGSLGHAEANAALLPHTLRVLRDRASELARLSADLGASLERTPKRSASAPRSPTLAPSGTTENCSTARSRPRPADQSRHASHRR
jgi:maleylacetate reductase